MNDTTSSPPLMSASCQESLPVGAIGRMVFMGSCEFALCIVQSLYAVDPLSLVAVFTAPAKPKGRGLRLAETCVAQWARQHSIPVYTPTSWRTPEACQILADLRPVVAVVASYGFIIPAAALSIPSMGFVNVHPSLLPRWRGASPMVSTLLHGDTKTGVTIMVMDEGMDTGPLLAQESIPIDPSNTTASELGHTLADMGGRLLTKVLPDYVNGRIKPTPQPCNGVTVAHKITKSMAQLDWSHPAPQLVCQINALQPWPGTWITIGNHTVSILRAIAYTDTVLRDDVPLGSFVSSQDPRLPPFPASHRPKLYGGIRCAHNTWLYPVSVRSPSGKTLTVHEWMTGFGRHIV